MFVSPWGRAGFAGPRTQAIGTHPAPWVAVYAFGFGALDRCCRLSPLAGSGTEAALETGIEEAQVVETALLSNLSGFGIGIPQQGNRPEQAQLHSEGYDGKAKMLLEKAAEVPTRATEPPGQFFNGQRHDFGGGKLLEGLIYWLGGSTGHRPAVVRIT